MSAKNEAIELLTHYFRQVYEETGLRWDHDNSTEIANLVEAIILAAKAESRYNRSLDEALNSGNGTYKP